MQTANAPTSVEMWGNGEIRLCSSTGGAGVSFILSRVETKPATRERETPHE